MTSGILLARYRDEPWQNAIAMGTAVAASVVMNPGTCESHPSQVKELLSTVEMYAL